MSKEITVTNNKWKVGISHYDLQPVFLKNLHIVRTYKKEKNENAMKVYQELKCQSYHKV